jgi:hypothetical protein
MLPRWFKPAVPLRSIIRCKTEIYGDSGIMPQALIDAATSCKKEEYMSEIIIGPVSRTMGKIKGQRPVENTQD